MQQQQLQLNKNVNLEFTPQQLTIVINLIRKGSHELVDGIISSIEKQVIKQLSPSEPKSISTEIKEDELKTEVINN